VPVGGGQGAVELGGGGAENGLRIGLVFGRTLYPQHCVEVVVGSSGCGRRRCRRGGRWAGGAAGGGQGEQQDRRDDGRAHADDLRSGWAAECIQAMLRAGDRPGQSSSKARIEAKPALARSARRSASATGSAPSRCSSATGSSSKKRLGASLSLAPQRCASRL